jgi:hypothetical protein
MSNPESPSSTRLSRIQFRVNIAIATLLPAIDEPLRQSAGEQLTRAIMEADAGVPFREHVLLLTY